MADSATILLVDSSKFFLTMERQFLSKTPASVVEAQTVEQALSLCRLQKPDLIYLDFALPGTNGPDFCRQLKADPGLNPVPIILLYDEAHPEQLDLSQQAGCDGVLTKPLDRRRFLELGRSLLAGIREPRRSCRLPVRFRRGKRLCTGEGLDISSGGLFLKCPETLEPGEALKVEIQLSLPGEEGPWIFVSGNVIWVNTPDGPLKSNHPEGYGVKFTVMSTQASAVLNGYLKKLG